MSQDLPGKLTNQEIAKYLRSLTLDQMSVVYNGCYDISTSHGWRIQAYDDCGEIDYIEEITAPDGRSLSFEEISDEVQDTFYGLVECW